MKELDSAKLLSASLKLSESRSSELVNNLRRELASKFDNIKLVEGVDGPQGRPGTTGDRGERGFIGSTGARGASGLQGVPGERGPQGEQGPTGELGAQGAQGTQGVIGEQGPPGVTGEMGLRGEQGLAGEQGPQGEMGLRGERGLTGDVGPIGPIGKNGISGQDGVTGRNGIDGKNGAIGPMGPIGLKGERGENGEKGDIGETGKQGPRGLVGPAADITPLKKQVDQFLATSENRISRIAYSATMGISHSSGGGEVNLNKLDDVDYASLQVATHGQALVYNATTSKWQAGTAASANNIATIATSTLGSLTEDDLIVVNVTGNVVTSNTVGILTTALNNALTQISLLDARIVALGG